MTRIKNKIQKNSVYVVFLIMFSLVVLPTNIKSIAIGLFSIVIIVNAIIHKNKFNWRYFLINSIFYFVILLTLVYSSFERASLHLQTMVSLLLFPLLFSLISKEDYFKIYNKKEKLFTVYILCVVAFNIIVFVWYSVTRITFFDTIKHYNEIMNTKLGKFNIHPIYMSMHICVSIVFGVWISIKKKMLLVKLIIPFLIFFLLILIKKGPLLALIISCIYMIIFILKKKQKKRALISLTLSLILLFSLPKIQEKFIELIEIEDLTEANISSTNIRVAIYKSSIKPIKNSFFFGYGIGDYQKVLTQNYSNKILIEKNYNSHNQYISILLIGGISLLIIFIVINIYNFNLALKNKNHLYIIISLFYLINMLTESILERESGVIFYSFFSCFFGLRDYYNRKINTIGYQN